MCVHCAHSPNSAAKVQLFSEICNSNSDFLKKIPARRQYARVQNYNVLNLINHYGGAGYGDHDHAAGLSECLVAEADTDDGIGA